MSDTQFVSRAELAEALETLRRELRQVVEVITNRLDRHERWLTLLSTGQVLTLMLLIYVVFKLAL